MVHTHDPREHIRGIHQILISDKKRIGFLFGAGSSSATGLDKIFIPRVTKMTEIVIKEIEENHKNFIDALKEIKNEVGDTAFNIESLLSSIEAKRVVIGSGKLNGLDSDGFNQLSKIVKTEIVKLVSVHKNLKSDDLTNFAHIRFANWVLNARRRYPTEIFTTNYDYLFEIALESFGIPYFDGFSGSFEPFFCTEAVEDIGAYPNLTKIWKMHGSLGWTYRDRDKAVIRDKGATAESVLIYPSHLKYNTSKKQPYVGLIDRLCTFLQQDDAVLFICGYSFGDDHINERIATSLRRGANSSVIAMYYDECTDTDGKTLFSLTNKSDKVREMARDTAGKMSIYGRRHAIIGGKFGEWTLRNEPNKSESFHIDRYFDEDAVTKPDEWKGTGLFLLPDFQKLTNFLNDLSLSSNPSNNLSD